MLDVLNVIGVSLGQSLCLAFLSIIITATLNRIGVIDRFFYWHVPVAFLVLCLLGNSLMSVVVWRVLLIVLTVALLIGSLLSLLFRLYTMTK